MKTILIIGAGRSTSYLINYLLDHAPAEQWEIRVGDVSFDHAKQKTGNHPHAYAFTFDVNNDEQRSKEIRLADIVISMLPTTMHMPVAVDCLRHKKHLVTASYISPEMKALHNDALFVNVVFLNECGLDPGLDHASAMRMIDYIHQQQGQITSFKSYCGGLVAPESNTNPWGYKFSWNPKNVVLAGQGTSKYIENGNYRYVPYSRLFLQVEQIQVKNQQAILHLEAYANRDSLSYRELYNIPHVPTMLRGTLRYPGYCKAWHILVKLGLTDDNCIVEPASDLTYKHLIDAYLPVNSGITKDNLIHFMGKEADAETIDKIDYLDILSDRKICFDKYTGKAPSVAQLLLDLLEEKWKLQRADKDMVVMQHQIEYLTNSKEQKKITSSLLVLGEGQMFTAMAKTVGLPLAIATKLILQGKITVRGVAIPALKNIYNPLLTELEKFDIRFEENEVSVNGK